MRIASVLRQGLASAAGVGREPDSGALARPAGRGAVAVPPGSWGGAEGSADAAEVEAAGRKQVPQVNPPLPDCGRCLGPLCGGELRGRLHSAPE